MANDEDLARIRQGAAAWNDWWAQNPKRRVDLSGADLSGAILHEAILREADLAGADLQGADLAGDRKSTRLNSSHVSLSRMPSSA